MVAEPLGKAATTCRFWDLAHSFRSDECLRIAHFLACASSCRPDPRRVPLSRTSLHDDSLFFSAPLVGRGCIPEWPTLVWKVQNHATFQIFKQFYSGFECDLFGAGWPKVFHFSRSPHWPLELEDGWGKEKDCADFFFLVVSAAPEGITAYIYFPGCHAPRLWKMDAQISIFTKKECGSILGGSMLNSFLRLGISITDHDVGTFLDLMAKMIARPPLQEEETFPCQNLGDKERNQKENVFLPRIFSFSLKIWHVMQLSRRIFPIFCNFTKNAQNTAQNAPRLQFSQISGNCSGTLDSLSCLGLLD